MILDELNGEMLHDAPLLCRFLESNPKNNHQRLLCTRILSRYSYELTAKQIKSLKCPYLTGLNRKVVRAKRMIDRKEYQKAIDLIESDLESEKLYDQSDFHFFSFLDDVNCQFYAKYFHYQMPGAVMMSTVENYGDAYFTLGMAYYYLEKDEEAEEALLKGKEWSPLHSEILRLLATIKMSHKQYDIAMQYLEEAISFTMEEDCISSLYETMSGLFEFKKKYELCLICTIISLFFNNHNEDAFQECAFLLDKKGFDLNDYPFEKVQSLLAKNHIPVGVSPDMAHAVFETCMDLEESHPQFAEQYYMTLQKFGDNENVDRRLAHLRGDEERYFELDANELELAILNKKLGKEENIYDKILNGSFLIPLKNSVPEDLLVDMQEAISQSAEDLYMDEFKKYIVVEEYDHKKAIPLYTRKKRMEENHCDAFYIRVRFDSLLYLVSVLDIDLYINPASVSDYYIDRKEFNRINDELIHQLGEATCALLKANAEPNEANIHEALEQLCSCDLYLAYNDVDPKTCSFEQMRDNVIVVDKEDGEASLVIYTSEQCVNTDIDVLLHQCDMEYVLDIFHALDGVNSIIVNSESNAEMILTEDEIEEIEENLNQQPTHNFLN